MKFFTTVALIGTASALQLQGKGEGESFEAHAERWLRENGVTDEHFAAAGVSSMEDAFEMADADGDKTVTLDEAADALAGCGFMDGDRDAIKTALDVEFHEWDTDNDGGLDMEESGWGFEEHALHWFAEEFGVTEQDFEDAGFYGVEDVFDEADIDSDGEVTGMEFATKLHEYGLGTEKSAEDLAGEIEAEFGFHDEDGSGGIDIQETGVDFDDYALWWMDETFGVTEQDFIDAGFTDIGDVFTMADEDGDGEVTPEEAATALWDNGVGLDWDFTELATKIGTDFGAYDDDKSGGIDIEETGWGFEDHALDWMAWRFDVTEADFAENGFTCMADVFAEGDADGDGQITPEEAAGALQYWGLGTDLSLEDLAAEVGEEFGAYDGDLSGGLDWNEVSGGDDQ